MIRVLLGLVPPIIVISAYHLAVQWLLPRLDLADDRSPTQRLWWAKISWGFIAFLIFADTGNLSFSVKPQPGSQNHAPSIWDTLPILGPIVLAVGIYKLGVYLASRRINRTAKPTTQNLVLAAQGG